MSETLGIIADQTYETTTAYENKGDGAETSPGNREEEPWGTDLLNFVTANQHVIVRCSWMGGAEVTLGQAMTSYNYPPNMTEKDVPAVMAVVNGLLANRVEKKEEPAEEEKAQADEPAKESQDDKPEVVRAKAEQTAAITKTENELQDERVGRSVKAEKLDKKISNPSKPAEKQAFDDDIDLPKEKTTATAQTKAVQPAPAAAGPKSASTSEAKTYDGLANQQLTSPKNLVNNKMAETKRAGREEDQPPVVLDLHQAKTPAKIDIQQTESDFNSKDSVLEEETEFVVPSELEPDTAAESPELNIRDDESLDYLEELSEQLNKSQLEASLDITSLDYEIAKDDLVEIYDRETLVSHHQEDAARLYEPDISEPTVINQIEQVDHINLPIEEIETSLLQAAKGIETVQPEMFEAVNGILDKIIELPAKLEAQNSREVTEAEVQRKLEELFIELFEQLGIEYTPELIESLARLTIQIHLSEEIQVLNKEEEDETPQDYGTHEVIKKLLAGSSNIKKIMANAYAIGKSALRLYRFDFPTELRKRLAAA